MRCLLPTGLLFTALVACSTGEGEGDVTAERLYLENCWDGPFDLKPTFFAANPFNESMMIRVQRGEDSVEVSDGILFVVNNVPGIREEQLGQSIPLGLPPGVSPPGLPDRVDLNPAQVSLTLYLYDTCHLQNGALYAVDGSIEFQSLFSGDPNETSAGDRLTEASFEATVVDPRNVELAGTTTVGGSVGSDGGTGLDGGSAASATTFDLQNPPIVYPQDKTSVISGHFRFFFQRGVPAQPFP